MKKKTLDFLEAHQSETPSTWREEAEWRRDNWSWLQHSQNFRDILLGTVHSFSENLLCQVLPFHL